MRFRVGVPANNTWATNQPPSGDSPSRHGPSGSFFWVHVMPALATALFAFVFRQDHLVAPALSCFATGVFVCLNLLLSLWIVERPLAAFLRVVAGMGSGPSFSVRGFARGAVALRFGQVVTSFGGTSEHSVFLAHPKNYSHKKMGGGSREALEKFWFWSLPIFSGKSLPPCGGRTSPPPIHRPAVPQYYLCRGQALRCS